MSALTAEEVAAKIQEVAAGYDSLGLANDELDQQDSNVALLVPESSVAMLIGKAGANMAQIKEACGAVLSFTKKEDSVLGIRRGHFKGALAAVTKGVFVVSSLLPSEGSLSISVVIAPQAAGAILGKGASNLKAIREATGCHLKMEKAEEASPAIGGRCLSIRGDTPLSVTLAFYQIIRTQGFASITQQAAQKAVREAAQQLAQPQFAGDIYGYGAVVSPGKGRPSPYARPMQEGYCAVHGKKRGNKNLQAAPTGLFVCLPTDPCKVSSGDPPSI